jgi:hypothetical protein
VVVGAQVAAEIVPMHQQHVVPSLNHSASFPFRRYTEQCLRAFGNPLAH